MRLLTVSVLIKLACASPGDSNAMLQVMSNDPAEVRRASVAELLSSQPIKSATSIGFGGVPFAENLIKTTTDHVLQRLASGHNVTWSNASLITMFQEEAEKTGLLQSAVETAKKMGRAYNEAGGGGYDMFFYGFQLHVGFELAFGPGIDFALFFPVCVSDQCTDKPGSVPLVVSKGDFKVCGAVMSGFEPFLMNYKSWMAPHKYEVIPLLLLGGGGYKYATGTLLELGGNIMTEYGELAAAVELSMTNPGDGVHLFVFELTHPDLNMGDALINHPEEHSHHHAMAMEAAGIAVAGAAFCGSTVTR